MATAEGPEKPDPAAPKSAATRSVLPPGAGASDLSSLDLSGALRSLGVHPDRVGPYRILKLLGEGGMGTVYLAAQVEPVKRQLALKVIRPGSETHEVVARFESERQALALMSHPGIARVYEAGADAEGRLYFAMEHVDGPPITLYCDAERLRIEERLELFIEVCDAVQHAHTKAVIHRDLKPSNILVALEDGRPRPKIIDFGIAKAAGRRLTDRTLHTLEGQMIGTPEYMSPEQAGGRLDDIDIRTDVYALGVLLYEILTGALPFDSDALRKAGLAEAQRLIQEVEPRKPTTRLASLGGELQRVAERRRVEPASLLRRVRGDLDWITMKAMRKERAERYPTARDLGEDLRRHLRHEPVAAGPPGALYRLRKFVRRHRGKLAAAAVLVLAAGAAALASRHLDHRVRAEESRRLVREAAGDWEEIRRLKEEIAREEKALAEAEVFYEPWQPVWEREEEVRAIRASKRARERREALYNGVVFDLHRAEESAPRGSAAHFEARAALEKLHWEGYQEALWEGEVAFTPAYFRSMMESEGVGAYARELEGSPRFLIESTPAGAEVFCFRYEVHEERLVPIPFAPAAREGGADAGLRAGPYLEVEAVWEPGRSPFRAGDRLLEVAGRRVRLHGDLARALAGTAAGAGLKALVLREGSEVALDWIPFPPDPPVDERGDSAPASAKEDEGPIPAGRVVDIYEQLGLTLAGYPLDLGAASRVGSTEESAPLAMDLPAGSYLFLLRLPGHAPARVPAVIPSSEGRITVRLFREEEVPPGYIHIPAGPFVFGGDRDAYMSLERGTAVVGDFFLARLEVTFAEYLEFLNDPEVARRIDPETGRAPPEVDWTGGIEKLGPKPRKDEKGVDVVEVQLVPELGGTLIGWRSDQDGKWRVGHQAAGEEPAIEFPGEWPALGVTMQAAREYALWRTRASGGRWRFRLPSDLEWEKAARGADRRLFVWGEHLFHSFCKSSTGVCGEQRRMRPDLPGIYPFDESVYGVRDLAGSMSEPVLALASRHLRFAVVRGGNWCSTDPRDFRIATRNRPPPDQGRKYVGLRLVAEPREPEAALGPR
jgi:serine/threonine protein kinase/formylglycine-generating enzyme required for sulfatase activity